MCGFRDSNAPIEKTHFYINKAYAEMYSNWEKDFQNKEAIPCSKISYKWMPNDYKGKSEIASKCCGNIAISLSNDEIMEIYNNRNSKATRVEFMASIMPRTRCVTSTCLTSATTSAKTSAMPSMTSSSTSSASTARCSTRAKSPLNQKKR